MSNINIIPQSPKSKLSLLKKLILAYYVINVYVPRVTAIAYHVLTTPPRVFRDPKMCLRNIWTAPKSIYTNSLAMLTHKQYEDNEPTSAISQAFRLDIFGNYAKSSLETHKSSCLALLSLCC